MIEYIHDPLGRRIAVKVNGVITEKYLWEGQTRLLAIYDGSGNLLMRFDYADGRMPYSMTSGGNTYYLTYDQVGSLRVITDRGGNILKRLDYDSFGNIIADTNPQLNVMFGFAGGLHDPDTGLVRFGYRDYNPDTGRWTAKDPILFAGGDTDLYGYVTNDPVNWIDPSGKAPGDGCGDEKTDWIVPDFYPYSCHMHDKCYATPDKKRAQCDNEFYWNMLIEKAPSLGPPIGAMIYWTGVRIWGGEAYRRAQGLK
jgi:RHS repeat-associated protein